MWRGKTFLTFSCNFNKLFEFFVDPPLDFKVLGLICLFYTCVHMQTHTNVCVCFCVSIKNTCHLLKLFNMDTFS